MTTADLISIPASTKRTPEQQVAIVEATRRFRAAGDPIRARNLERRFNRGEAISAVDLGLAGPVNPERPLETIPVPPPFDGPEATGEAWRSFAHQVADLDEDVLAYLSRTQIVELLTNRGILGKEEEEEKVAQG